MNYVINELYAFLAVDEKDFALPPMKLIDNLKVIKPNEQNLKQT